MDSKKLQSLITDLIRMDIINYKMMHHFVAMQIEAEDYSLGIDRIIFEFLNIENRPDVDEIFETYMKEYQQILELNLQFDKKKIDRLAKSLYKTLNFYSRQQIDWELPADTQAEVNAGRVTYRGCGIDGRNAGLYRLKIHKKEYIVTLDTLRSFQKDGQRIRFAAPFRRE